MEPPNVRCWQSLAGCKRNMASDRDGRCMMHKSLITAISSLAAIALLSITNVHAATYNFTFQSSGAELTATGQFTVDATDQVTGVSGVITGLVDQTIKAVTANPGFPSPSYSPDGLFIYDSVYHQ